MYIYILCIYIYKYVYYIYYIYYIYIIADDVFWRRPVAFWLRYTVISSWHTRSIFFGSQTYQGSNEHPKTSKVQLKWCSCSTGSVLGWHGMGYHGILAPWQILFCYRFDNGFCPVKTTNLTFKRLDVIIDLHHLPLRHQTRNTHWVI